MRIQRKRPAPRTPRRAAVRAGRAPAPLTTEGPAVEPEPEEPKPKRRPRKKAEESEPVEEVGGDAD